VLNHGSQVLQLILLMGDGQVQLVTRLYQLVYHDIFLSDFVLQMVATESEARGRHLPPLSLPAGVLLQSKELLIERVLVVDHQGRGLQLKYPLGRSGIVHLYIFKVIRKQVRPHIILLPLITIGDARELKR
jgi:hypothetical protein